MIEDSEDDAALLLRELRRGYSVSYERVDTPAAMIAALNKQEWDLVVSDHSMPHFSGIDALNLLRRTKGTEVPFIFVSGEEQLEAAAAGSSAGTAGGGAAPGAHAA
jgi:CheY-like chemotaxis protein